MSESTLSRSTNTVVSAISTKLCICRIFIICLDRVNNAIESSIPPY